MYKIKFLFLLSFSVLMISACKEDKKLPLEESIQIDGNKAPLLGIDITETPVESDNGNYLSAEVNQSVSLTYEGMEKNTITWEIDGVQVSTGDQFSINHQWDSPGMKTVKAILSNGEERTAFVRVSISAASSPEPLPQPVPATASPKPKTKPEVNQVNNSNANQGSNKTPKPELKSDKDDEMCIRDSRN